MDEVIPAGRPYRIFGSAWCGESRIAKVELSADGGKTWILARLLDKPAAFAWCLWELVWNVPEGSGAMTISARATDEQGNTQPLQRDPDRRNYMINHVVPVSILVK